MSSVSFGEHDIRPAEVLGEEMRLYEAEVARLLERSAEFVDVPCPACGKAGGSTRFSKYTFNFRECEGCRTLYVSPRPPPAVLKSYYENNRHYQFWNSTIFPASESVRRPRIFRPRVERVLELCAKHGVSTGTLLEVGAGFGTFCDELRSTGRFQRIIAIEPTASLAESCRARGGIEVLEQRVEEVTIDGRVDVVASFEVIEHLFDPGVLVQRCAELLSPGGLVVITCPNLLGFDIEILGPQSPAVAPEHLNYFHPASLSLLFERHGLRVLETATPGRLDADIVRNRVLEGSFELTDPFLRRVLIDEWPRLGEPFQDFLANNGLSSNMWVVATKE